MSTTKVKLFHNGKAHSATIIEDGDHIYIKTGYKPALTQELKETLSGAHWCGFDDKNPRKLWRFDNDERTRFRLNYLMGNNPYAPYDAKLPEWPSSRSLYDHQAEMASHWYTRHYAIIAGEMGTGKTLAAIEVAERVMKEQGLVSTYENVWYIGPKTGVSAIQRECRKWDSFLHPRCFTYQGLVAELKNWNPSTPTPRIVIVDESSQTKSPTAQRSQAVMHLVRSVYAEYGNDGYAVLMSGTPSPKSPIDWWYQAEIACPGFLREQNIHIMKQRMAILAEKESAAGGVFKQIVAWKDRDDVCVVCGEEEDHTNHQRLISHSITGRTKLNNHYHKFEPAINEVAKLFKRLAGLVIVKFKKDCLDLPEKQYVTIKVKPTLEVLRAAKTIKNTATRAVTALTLLRELSDGFQYTEEKCGMDICSVCGGAGQIEMPVQQTEGKIATDKISADDYKMEMGLCPHCGGVGEVPRYRRARADVSSPKDDVLIDLMEEFEECGRMVVWAGFSGSIDKLVKLFQEKGWATLRYDSKVIGTDAEGNPLSTELMLDMLDGSHPNRAELLRKYPKVAFLGHPKAGGMALTLTASPGCVYYSNDFSGEARIQSEDRTHRAGMDANRGCMVYDLEHLPTDRLVIENLKRKRNLQAMTLGEITGVVRD